MKSLKDKVVVVTGAGSGMGREISLLCSARGAVVALADYNLASAEETAALIAKAGGKTSVHKVDVSDQAAVNRFAAEVVAKHGTVDVLFNNAGIIPKIQRFEKTSADVFVKMFAVNFYGVLFCTQAFLPELLKRPEAALVNTSSAAGLVGYLGLSSYAASKFAVRGFSEALRMEYHGSGLTVSVVHPGAINTNIAQNSPFMTEEDKKAMASGGGGGIKMLSAAEAARGIVDGMQAKKTRIIVGSDAKMQDRMARLLPQAYTGLIYSKMKDMLE